MSNLDRVQNMSASDYEDHVAAVLSEKFAGHGKVERNVRLPSRSGVRPRQIDVLIRMPLPGLGDFLIVVDAKRYSGPVDANTVEGFIGLVTDVGAEMGLLVTNHGFTEGAEARITTERGIRLDVVAIDDLDQWEAPLILCRACSGSVREDSLPGMVWLDERAELEAKSGQEFDAVTVTLGTCDRCGSAHIECPDCGTLIVPAEWAEGEWNECEGGCGLTWYRRRLMLKDDLSAPEHALLSIRLPEHAEEGPTS